MQRIFFLLSAALLLSGCSGGHLLEERSYREKVEKEFEERKSFASRRSAELFSVLSGNLSVEEKEALLYLYVSMPLSDLADYTGDFFYSNCKAALKARKENPWGKKYSNEIFLHYVLPPRVNNENLDSFRLVYYDEINERVSGLSDLDAALEINHWCHEKVIYKPADIRTSSPMATVLSARGRCGEESTFTVAALRTAGIPARQVYTPRWAHTDDNHAWVEFWVDGKWHYMGACEPEPNTDLGWFTEPARRAMLVHTKSFGVPTDEENVIRKFHRYSLVNSLSRYAETGKLRVFVKDSLGKPIEGATVQFLLYNSAEFYPIAELISVSDGSASLETGKGDLIVRAGYKGLTEASAANIARSDSVTIILKEGPQSDLFLAYDIVPPSVPEPYPAPPAENVRLNKLRLAEEDSIRQVWTASWPSPDKTKAMIEGWPGEPEFAVKTVTRSEGNFMEIFTLLGKITAEKAEVASMVLEEAADKDLRDTPCEIFEDHINNTVADPATEKEIFSRYVANPRIANELIIGWRSFILGYFSKDVRDGFLEEPRRISEYLDSAIVLADEENYYGTPITPRGVLSLGAADRHSRNICFVAICRTLGIPSRIEEGTGNVQYYRNDEWYDVKFLNNPEENAGKGYLSLKHDASLPVPEYYVHFTLARFDGLVYRTLDFDFGRRINSFPDEIKVDAGFYMLVTGSRQSGGSVLTAVSYFTLKDGEKKSVEVSLRKNELADLVLGRADLSAKYILDSGETKKIGDTEGNGTVFIWLDGASEPSKHILNDLIPVKEELQKWGGRIIIFGYSDELFSGGQSLENTLPVNYSLAKDNQNNLLASLTGSISCGEKRLPVVIAINKEGEILHYSSGYTIGTGAHLIKVLQR